MPNNNNSSGLIQTKELNNALDNAGSIITKSYLEELDSYEVVELNTYDQGIDIAELGAFYKLRKLVINKDESFLDKLATVVNVAFSANASLVTIIHSDGIHIDYYAGIVSKGYPGDDSNDTARRVSNAEAFSGALKGNLIGSDIEQLTEDKISELRNTIFGSAKNNIASISGIVSPRDDNETDIKKYVQGIENLVDSLRGKKYSIIMIADPISQSGIQTIRSGYEILHTQLSSFLRQSVTISSNDSTAISKARTEGVTKGISTGVTTTQSNSHSKGRNYGVSAQAGFGIGALGGPNFHAGLGVSAGTSTVDTTSFGKADVFTEVNQQASSTTDSVQTSTGSGKSIQINYDNRTVKSLIDKIDRHLKRLDMCDSLGAFDCAAYCIAENTADTQTVADNYCALMRGGESGVQSTQINMWSGKKTKTKIVSEYLSRCIHPKFKKKTNNTIFDDIILTPASIISGKELAIQIGLPKKSVAGVTVIPMAAFGRNIIPIGENDVLETGNLYHMGQTENIPVYLSKKSLASHTFITGSTGSGKSNAVYTILSRLRKDNVKFLVVEPAKGEYKNVFGGLKDVSVYGTNPEYTEMLRLNPFSFPKGIHVYEHLDRLIEIFNACWPMYAAMPAILKDAVERAYQDAGWDLVSSNNEHNIFPTFSDVLLKIDEVLQESKYSSDNKGDYTGALSTRIRSMTTGINRLIFTPDELPYDSLFDENVIVDLSRIGSAETKSLIMGLLVIKQQEYRISENRPANDSLNHVTVLEEAHNLLKRTSSEQTAESSNLIGKSVEMLANAIAEMRTYGEGYIIADQSPGLMDMSVIRNTNTKIILRLPDLTDRQLVGKAANLTDEQIDELARLPLGVAAVYQNNWNEPVLCQFDRYADEAPYTYSGDTAGTITEKTLLKQALDILIKPNEYIKFDEEEFINSQIPSNIKKLMFDYLDKKDVTMEDKAEIAAAIADASGVFEAQGSKDVETFKEIVSDKLKECIYDYTDLQLQCLIALILNGKTESDLTYKKLYMQYVDGIRR